MKKLVVCIAMAMAGALVVVQAQQHDPDKMAAGSGTLPAGWQARLDSGATKPEGVQVTAMGSGVHFVSGPAGIYWKPGMTKSGVFEVTATFNQMAASAHPEAYGLIIGGADLAGANQKYTYFLVRQDGMFLIKRRAGTTTPTIADWTTSPAVKKTDASTKGVNALTIAVAQDKVRFLVNGTEVAAVPSSQVDTSGIVGLRINHNLNVHVEGFGVK